MDWPQDALRAITLRGWRSTTSCRSRMSFIHPPRLRSGWTTWHSERSLRRVRWSTRRRRRIFSWCGTFKRTRWRLRQSQRSLQLHRASSARHDIHSQGADQAKDFGLHVSSARKPNNGQEMDQGWETYKKMREVWKMDFEASQCTAMENGSLGAESPRNGGLWGRRRRGSSGESRSSSSVRRTRQGV